jgi:hypothetical protein
MVLTPMVVSAGVANAAPVSPTSSGPQVLADDGPGRGHGHGHDEWWWDDGPGPNHWDPVDACVGVQGPFGWVQGSACI